MMYRSQRSIAEVVGLVKTLVEVVGYEIRTKLGTTAVPTAPQ